MKYRKKPVVIEAFQYFDDMGNYTYQIPIWFNEAVLNKIIFVDDNGITWIKTSEGNMRVNNKDYVIKEPFDRIRKIYPCKPDIFEKTYELVTDA